MNSTNNCVSSAKDKLFAWVSLILGILGLVAIVSPVFGIFFSAPGLIIGILGRKHEGKMLLRIGILMNIISLLIAVMALIGFGLYYRSIKY